MPDCPFASRCWMAGNYVFCKTAKCTEPLIERNRGALIDGSAIETLFTEKERNELYRQCAKNERAMVKTSEMLPMKLVFDRSKPPHDNGGDCLETVAVQTIQGELF